MKYKDSSLFLPISVLDITSTTLLNVRIKVRIFGTGLINMADCALVKAQCKAERTTVHFSQKKYMNIE